MTLPELPDNEAERVRVLHELRILDTVDEPAFDAIARLASLFHRLPDRCAEPGRHRPPVVQGVVGLAMREAPRRHALCALAILSLEVMVVEDTWPTRASPAIRW
jgi:hypothetical protein